ncbi:hypothetical protein BRX37_16510 [Sphingomonas sp. S-NIH.Pt3_0716]|nr:hypothetical protein BRX37_16510 [Sphingomonas sp. S-NIH.Pt3_0716]
MLAQEDQLRAKIAQRQKLMAIDGRTARVQAQANRYKQEGQQGLMWGAAMAYPAYEMAKSAGEFEAMRNRLHILGLNDRTVDHLTAYSKAMNIAGSSAKENLRYLLEAQGAFRESGEHSMEEQLRGAKVMAPLMAKMAATLRATGKPLDEEQERYFLRFIEQAGGTTDPRRAASLTDGLFRAIQSSGGTVDAAAYQGFLARAGTAGMKLSTRSMFADFEPLIAELHDAAGVGLQTAYSRVNGMVKNQAAAREMIRLGLWDRDKIIFNQVGGIKEFKRGENPLRADAANSMASDPIEFYRKFVLPAYQQNGVKDVQRENMMLFGRTGGQLFNLIDKQLPTILRSRDAYARTQSLDKAYNQTKDGFFGEGGQMRAAWQDFMIAAGSQGGLLENMTGAIRLATGALRALTDAANTNPTAFRWIATGIAALIGMRLAIAGTKLAFGGLLGPVGQLWGAWSKFRQVGSIAAAFPRLAAAFGIVRGAALFMAQGVMRAGLMMLANPMVLAITGIVLALGAAGYLIYSHWGRISGYFRDNWTQIRNIMLGAVVIFAPWIAAIVYAASVVYRNWGTIIAATGRMVGYVGSIVGPFLQPFVAIGSYLGGLAGRFFGYGVDIVGGLIRGVASMTGSVIKAFLNLAGAVGAKFAAALGIKSPSRVFMAMGGHINDGLALGVTRTSGRPMQAMTRMAAAVAGAGAITLPAPALADAKPLSVAAQRFANSVPAGALTAAQQSPRPVTMPAPAVVLQSRPAPIAMPAPSVALQGRPVPIAMPAPVVLLQSRPATIAMRAPAVILQSRPNTIAVRAPAFILQGRSAPVTMRTPAVMLQSRPAPVSMRAPAILLQSRPATMTMRAPAVVLQSRPAPVPMRTPAVMLQGRPVPVTMRAPAVMLQSRPATIAMRAPAVMLQSRPLPVTMRAPAVILQSRPATIAMRAPAVAFRGRPSPVVTPPNAPLPPRKSFALTPMAQREGRENGGKAFAPPAGTLDRLAAARTLAIAPTAASRPIRASQPPAKIEIHLHQQPGEDADALIRRMMEALKREQRKTSLSQHADDF